MNLWDQNTNTDDIYSFTNTNSPNGVKAFVGNVLALERCAYVFNFAVSGSTKTYNINRYTVSIEYVQSLLKKKTIINLKNSYSMTQLATAASGASEDFPCGVSTFYYHPGI